MTDTHQTSNPFTPNTPAFGRSFVGRQDVIAWVRQYIYDEKTQSPLIVRGNAKMGKTSLLKQIAAGAVNPTLQTVYIDLAEWTGHGLADFLHFTAGKVGAEIQNQLNSELTPLAVPALAEFAREPEKVFEQWVFSTLVDWLNGRLLLLLFDNLHVMLGQMTLGVLPENSFDVLINATGKPDTIFTLFALNHTAAAVPTERIQALNQYPMQELTALTQNDAKELIAKGAVQTVVNDVVTFMFEQTNGHPQALQKLCYHLFLHQQSYNLHQLTVADVTAVGKKLGLNPTKNTYTLQPTPFQKRLKRRTRFMPYIWRGAAIAVVLLAVLGVGVFAAQGLRPSTSSTPQIADNNQQPIIFITPTETVQETAVPTETATATPAPTETPTPTPSPTPRPSATPTATATPNQLPTTRIRSTDGANMVLIPAGTFLMGASSDDFIAGPDEKPRHVVALNAFYIDQYEVTVAQYAAFLTRIGGYRKNCEQFDCAWPRKLAGYTSYLIEQDLGDGSIQYTPLAGFSDYPINNVSWYGANAYCQAVGGRLPTEAEWEYAARGTDGRIYPWGNEPPDETRAVFNSPDYNNLKPVDALPAGVSPFNVYGMAGSMWEWVADWYDESFYSKSPTNNPTGPETGLTRVIRGGAWPNNNLADRIRASNRSSLTPEFISATVGFRCAMNP